MESTTQPEYRSPITRLAIFLRDFLPEQNLQLLFPLGSFLLLLGSSRSWYELQLPGVSEVIRQLHSQVDSNALQRFTHSLTVWVALEEEAVQYVVRLAFFASLILWTLSVRKALSRIAASVFLPVGFVLAAFPSYLIATAHARNSFLDAFVNSYHVASVKHTWFPNLGEWFYLSIAGLIVFAFGLFLVRRSRISLPLRFRSSAGAEELTLDEAPHDARNLFIFLIVTWTLAVVISNFIALPQQLGKNPLRSWRSGTFPIFEWAPAVANAAAAACLAFVLFGKEKWQTANRLLRVQPFRSYALAVGIPLAVVLIPRFLLGVVFSSDRWTPESFELFIPHPLPRVLLVYVIALFEEFAVRGYLQTMLQRHLNVRRSVFLTGLLWTLLPLGFGMAHSLPHSAFAEFPGVSFLVQFATFTVYSVPLGWLYARTRSVLPVALMHGTIALFHVGMGYEIHINRPEFYWVELALWIFVGWYLFKKHPLESAEARGEPEVAPA